MRPAKAVSSRASSEKEEAREACQAAGPRAKRGNAVAPAAYHENMPGIVAVISRHAEACAAGLPGAGDRNRQACRPTLSSRNGMSSCRMVAKIITRGIDNMRESEMRAARRGRLEINEAAEIWAQTSADGAMRVTRYACCVSEGGCQRS